MTIKTSQPGAASKRRTWQGIKTLITLILIALCLGLLIWALGRLIADARDPSPVDLAREQAELERIQLTSTVGKIVYVVVVSVGVLGGILLFAFAVVSAGLWMWRRAAMIRPDERGLMPMFHGIAVRLNLFSRWIEVRSLIVDPNRSPTAVIEVGAGTENGIAFVAPDQVSAAQMQATMGAQLVQATVAEASGTKTISPSHGTRGTRGRTALQGQPELVIYQREQPAIARLPIPDSHIERLLVEQGQLIPQEVLDQGQADI
jgi:hypothetical protein